MRYRWQQGDLCGIKGDIILGVVVGIAGSESVAVGYWDNVSEAWVVDVFPAQRVRERTVREQERAEQDEAETQARIERRHENAR